MRFFEGKKLKLDFRPERHEFLEVRDERCDLRVAAALLMLINSRDTDILHTSPHEYTPERRQGRPAKLSAAHRTARLCGMAIAVWTQTLFDAPPSPSETGVYVSELTADGKRFDRSSARVLGWPQREVPPGGTVEEYVQSRKRGVRSFVLWRDQNRSEAWARVVTHPASQPDCPEYEVRGADGEVLAVVRRQRGSLPDLRRPRWTVELRGHEASWRAWKGAMLWWAVWVPLLPVQYLLAIVSLGSFVGVEPPRRMRFAEDGRLKLRYHPGQRRSFLEVRDERCDLRVAAALLLLIHSWETSVLNSSPYDHTP
jgi:hypothetical protein